MPAQNVSALFDRTAVLASAVSVGIMRAAFDATLTLRKAIISGEHRLADKAGSGRFTETHQNVDGGLRSLDMEGGKFSRSWFWKLQFAA